MRITAEISRILVPRDKRAVLSRFDPEPGTERLNIRANQVLSGIEYSGLAHQIPGFGKTQVSLELEDPGIDALFRLEIIERAQQTVAPIFRNSFDWVEITLSVEKLDLFLSQYLGHFILPGLYLN